MIAGLIVRSFWDYGNPRPMAASGNPERKHHRHSQRNPQTGHHIRTKGVMNAIISSEELRRTLQKARAGPR
ncbi:MAG: hypothetical protein U5K69_29685 [Balneolaceae bacterium]|nr:hypothetical protein [Balneolaceae bacterium]